MFTYAAILSRSQNFIIYLITGLHGDGSVIAGEKSPLRKYSFYIKNYSEYADLLFICSYLKIHSILYSETLGLKIYKLYF